MIATPFYSDKDTSLIKETTVRDYLGVLPVWSKVARGLEPNQQSTTISPNANTIAKGLYPFYRGTCRRAGMLSPDWILDSDAILILDKLSQPHDNATTSLINIIEQHISKKDAPIYPFEVLQNKDIKALFGALFSSADLVEYFKLKLFTDPELAKYAQVCYLQRQANNQANALTLALAIQTHILCSAGNYVLAGFASQLTINGNCAVRNIINGRILVVLTQ
jgi:hypothetical protein